MKKPNSRVKGRWVDSRNHPGWHTIVKSLQIANKDEEPIEFEGIFVAETERYITIAQMRTANAYLNLVKIPKCCIVDTNFDSISV